MNFANLLYLEIKIQYGFHLSIRKYLLTTCHNENTYLPQHYFIQQCKAVTFTLHRRD